jgi:hypothetical protein
MMENLNHGAGASASETLLLEIVGLRFLEYVLNEDEAAIRAHFQGSALEAPREDVLGELVMVLGQLIPDPDTDSFLRQIQLDALGTFDEKAQTSYINTLRARCGGSIDAGLPGDPVVSRLLPVARDMYPLFLLPLPPGPFATAFAPSMARSLFNHPGRRAFDDAVLVDPELTQLFPDGTEHIERSGQFRSSAGRGGSVQLAMFAELLMRNTWAWLKVDTASPTLGQFLAAVATSVGLVRDAIMGRSVEVPLRIGLTGVKLPENSPEVALPWGKLRAVRELDREMVPSSIIGALSTTTAEGVQVVIDYSGDVVFEMDIPYEIELGHVEIGAEWPQHLRGFETVQRKIESIQLGLLLAISRERQPMVVVAWQRTLDLLAHGTAMSWSDTRRTPNLVPYQLTPAEVQAWSQWTADVDGGRVASIEVAIRRTIRAAVERADPSDALVDAVIAWENLVGSRQGEPTLRISAALAWLLEDDPSARRTRQTALKRLYDLRSDVVHGNRPLGGSEAAQGSRDARAVAVEALRRLLRDRPEVLRECRDGAERSLRLMLG